MIIRNGFMDIDFIKKVHNKNKWEKFVIFFIVYKALV